MIKKHSVLVFVITALVTFVAIRLYRAYKAAKTAVDKGAHLFI